MNILVYGVTVSEQKSKKDLKLSIYLQVDSYMYLIFVCFSFWIRSIHSWSQCKYKSIIQGSADFLWEITLCSAIGQRWRYIVNFRQTEKDKGTY